MRYCSSCSASLLVMPDECCKDLKDTQVLVHPACSSPTICASISTSMCEDRHGPAECETNTHPACVQALEKARTDAAEAGAAVKTAERQLVELERGVVRARMEAKSLRERAQDLAERLTELRAATKARCHVIL